MATDVIDRLHQRAGGSLDPDETYLGAQPMTVRGRHGLSSLLEGRDLDEVLSNHVARHGSISELRTSDEWVPNAFLAAVTNCRLLIFRRALGGRPKELIAEHHLDSLTLDVIDHGSRARARTYVFSLGSGEVFAGDSGVNGPALEAADRFVEVFTEASRRGS
jgi:hypothetical protein